MQRDIDRLAVSPLSVYEVLCNNLTTQVARNLENINRIENLLLKRPPATCPVYNLTDINTVEKAVQFNIESLENTNHRMGILYETLVNLLGDFGLGDCTVL